MDALAAEKFATVVSVKLGVAVVNVQTTSEPRRLPERSATVPLTVTV